MPEELAKLLNLDVAWRRVKADIHDRVFIRHPYEVKLIELDLAGWLDSILDSVQKGTYNPSPLIVCDVPKGGGAVRPGAHLSLVDRVMYAAYVGACFPHIHRSLFWSQGQVDFSYRLSIHYDNPVWIRSRFHGWRAFQNKSIEKIEEDIPYVLIADIAGYYENIDISTLISDLRQTGAPADAVIQLSSCLNRWAQVSGRGIPQGQSPSDILGKLYLNAVDIALREMGYSHYRYVDDFRIFCRSRIEAKKAIVDLIRLLRPRGLGLEMQKSRIYQTDEAKAIIEGVMPILDTVRDKFVAKIIRHFKLPDAYISMPEAEKILSREPDDTTVEIIRETYKTYFIDSTDDSFNSTLFHFLLNRLGKHKDKFAVEHCMTLLEKHPEETRTILDYLSRTVELVEIEDSLIEFLNSQDAIYPYQNYQIIEYVSSNPAKPSEALMAISRRLGFDNSQPPYLRSFCRKILGDFGSIGDLERLQDSYSEARNSLEQSEIICSLKRMETGRRNTFLARAEHDGELNRRSSIIVKSGGI